MDAKGILQTLINKKEHDINVVDHLTVAAVAVAILMALYLILCYLGLIKVEQGAKEIDTPKIAFEVLTALVSFGFKMINSPAKTNLTYLQILSDFLSNASPEEYQDAEKKVIDQITNNAFK